MAMKEAKRRRLRRTVIEHMYDEHGKLAGHKVIAENERDDSEKGKDGMYTPPPRDIETPHETHESAIAKAVEHHEANKARFGAGAKDEKKKFSMPQNALRGAMAMPTNEGE